MKNKHLLLLVFLMNIKVLAQVGINTDRPDPYAGLHISERMDPADPDPDKYNGIIIQRYTEVQRDTQLTPYMSSAENSMLIFNTTQDCYNYWNNTEHEWKSLCGNPGRSQFTFDCAALEVKGTYVKERELTSANFISVPVNVTKPGAYTFSATTGNGYSFIVSGTFLNIGQYTIQAVGQGKPINSQTDDLTIIANGMVVTCTPSKTVNVLSLTGTYTIACGSAVINGTYKAGVPLTSANSITLPVQVTSVGSYSISSNTVDGISFRGSGTFSAVGNQNVVLQGTGAPTSTSTKTLTITSDSQGALSTSCNVNVSVVIPKKRLLSIGTDPNGYGYNFAGTAASNRLITTSTNYGTLTNSVVKFDGWEQIINGSNFPSVAQLTEWTTGSDPVDIIVIGYSWNPTPADAQLLADYLAKGGVVLAFTESGIGGQSLLRAVFDTSVSVAGVNSAGALYKFPLTADPILNGPFGDIRGLQWGEDASVTQYALGLPASDVTVYSGDTNISTATPSGNAGRVTAFRHNSLNFIWVGDGGFNSNNGSNSDIICPFFLNSSNFPVFKPNYGNGAAAYKKNVYNSIFTANAFAWAIQRAEFNGINTQ